MTSEQTPEGGEGGSHWGASEQQYSRPRAQPVQRPWGRTVPSVLEEQQRGPCGCSTVSEGERGRRGGQGGDGAGRAGPCGLRGGLGLLPQGGGSPGGLWAEKGWGLTQVLTGALWLLWGGQTMRGEDGNWRTQAVIVIHSKRPWEERGEVRFSPGGLGTHLCSGKLGVLTE